MQVDTNSLGSLETAVTYQNLGNCCCHSFQNFCLHVSYLKS